MRSESILLSRVGPSRDETWIRFFCPNGDGKWTIRKALRPQNYQYANRTSITDNDFISNLFWHLKHRSGYFSHGNASHFHCNPRLHFVSLPNAQTAIDFPATGVSCGRPVVRSVHSRCLIWIGISYRIQSKYVLSAARVHMCAFVVLIRSGRRIPFMFVFIIFYLCQADDGAYLSDTRILRERPAPVPVHLNIVIKCSPSLSELPISRALPFRLAFSYRFNGAFIARSPRLSLSLPVSVSSRLAIYHIQ